MGRMVQMMTYDGRKVNVDYDKYKAEQQAEFEEWQARNERRRLEHEARFGGAAAAPAAPPSPPRGGGGGGKSPRRAIGRGGISRVPVGVTANFSKGIGAARSRESYKRLGSGDFMHRSEKGRKKSAGRVVSEAAFKRAAESLKKRGYKLSLTRGSR